MSQHSANILWQGQKESFQTQEYLREHQWRFDNGFNIRACASPQIVTVPLFVKENIDPEEAFVATVSSCQMLTFLQLALKKRWIVTKYEDQASGTVERNQRGRLAITKVTLCPTIEFEEELPSLKQVDKLHEISHQNCLIANSIQTEISIQTKIYLNAASQ